MNVVGCQSGKRSWETPAASLFWSPANYETILDMGYGIRHALENVGTGEIGARLSGWISRSLFFRLRLWEVRRLGFLKLPRPILMEFPNIREWRDLYDPNEERNNCYPHDIDCNMVLTLNTPPLESFFRWLFIFQVLTVWEYNRFSKTDRFIYFSGSIWMISNARKWFIS